MIANYHTHTFRCHHALGTDEDYVTSAIANGIQILGFSDHGCMIGPDYLKQDSLCENWLNLDFPYFGSNSNLC